MTLAPEAFHGPLGRVVRYWEPHTEAAPSALFVALLTFAGNQLPGAYFQIEEGDVIRCNLHSVLVGLSGTGRKSHTIRIARRLAEYSAPDNQWQDRIHGHHSSGESLVEAVADLTKDTEDETAGSSDKRLTVVLDEFAMLVAAAGRQNSTLGPVLRQAWDGSPISSRSRRAKLAVREHHISLLAAVTRDELRHLLAPRDAASGTTNRFLFCRAAMTKALTGGSTMEREQWEEMAAIVRAAVRAGMGLGRVRLSREGFTMWDGIYQAQFRTPPTGWDADFVARKNQQVLKVALSLAALDGSKWMEPVHISAAEAVWDGSVETMHWVWGDPLQSKLAARAYAVISDSGIEGVSRTDLDSATGGPLRDKLNQAVDDLETAGFIHIHPERKGTRGPKATVYRAVEDCHCNGHRPPALTTDQKMRQALGR